MSDLLDRLREAGRARYHDRHPLHLRMHAGEMDRAELRLWAHNRFYYQTRIPIKDALILAKSEDPEFRRVWLRRIVHHDGAVAGEGGLALWRRLARALGASDAELDDPRSYLPGVREACDAYVELVRGASLLEAVALSLTELFAPELMQRRLEAWQRHYPWVPREALDYFRVRVGAASLEAEMAFALVRAEAKTPELEQRAVTALVRKTELLWAMADAIEQGARSLRGAA